jgi:tetratricopeptide (TPR) repeat protein
MNIGHSVMRVLYSKKITALVPTALALLLWVFASVESAKQQQAESDFQFFSVHLAQKQYSTAQSDIERVVARAPRNANYLAGQGLLFARLSQQKFNSTAFLGNKLTHGKEELKEIAAAAHLYQQALALNPLDDGHYHNLGWLYAMQQQREEALRSFQQAISIDGSIALYHVSLGLLREQGGEQEETRDEYARAIHLSPDIVDSQFFRDFTARSPGTAGRVISQSMADLEEQLRQSPNAILKGKLGKLYLHANSLEKASALLRETVTELPSLPRPWANLGVIYERQGNEAAALECYRRAAILSPSDAQSWSKLGYLHDRTNNKQDAINSYMQAVDAWMNMMSEHAGRTSRIYQTRFVISDDIVPNGFLAYCNPALNVSEICGRLAQLYKEMGDSRRSAYYEDLSAALSSEKSYE